MDDRKEEGDEVDDFWVDCWQLHAQRMAVGPGYFRPRRYRVSRFLSLTAVELTCSMAHASAFTVSLVTSIQRTPALL